MAKTYTEEEVETIENLAYDKGYEEGEEDSRDLVVPGTPTVIIDEDFEHMIVSAVRYALGRQTYITWVTAKYVGELVSKMTTKMLSVIKADIDYYEKRRGQGLIYDDEECDHIHWVVLLNKINEELEKREING